MQSKQHVCWWDSQLHLNAEAYYGYRNGWELAENTEQGGLHGQLHVPWNAGWDTATPRLACFRGLGRWCLPIHFCPCDM